MWLDNLKDIKKEKGITTKQLAERSNLPEKTVSRILSGNTANPYIDTLDRLATALDCKIGDILAGTNTVIGDTKLSTLQDNVVVVTAEKESVKAERDLLLKENTMLKEKVSVQATEIELLKLKLMYTEQLLATHNYYNKIKTD